MKKFFVFFICIGLLFQTAKLEGQFPGMDFFNEAFSAMQRAFDDLEFTPKDAYYLGRALAANILSTHSPYTGNPCLTRYLNKICMAIAVNSAKPELFAGYRVIILDTLEFNAFATPGGHILITRGLIEAATSEDELAAVIAHELAHIILEHGLGIVRKMELSNHAALMAARAAAFAGNPPAAQRLFVLRDSVTAIMDTMMKNGFSRYQEFEADLKAMTLLAAAGYNPGALIDVLRILERVQSSREGGFNSTHPSPADRIANAEAALNRYHVPDTSSYRQLRFNYIMNR